MMYKNFLKRLIDILLSFAAIIILSPVFFMVGVLSKIFIGKPILFKQIRPGKNEDLFTIYKFRTMTNERDEKGYLLPERFRLNMYGRFLRTTSIDELPELFNILKGEMSLVGPRPLLPSYLPLYSESHKRRHTVRPGLTGLAQVNGRNSIGWEEKFEYDLKYLENITFCGDMKIIILTIKKIFTREGITPNNSETTKEFKGY